MGEKGNKERALKSNLEEQNPKWVTKAQRNKTNHVPKPPRRKRKRRREKDDDGDDAPVAFLSIVAPVDNSKSRLQKWRTSIGSFSQI
jgi:hypothetical protein